MKKEMPEHQLNYHQIVAGALAKYGYIEHSILSLIINDICRALNAYLFHDTKDLWPYFGNYVTLSKNMDFSLKEGVTLDTVTVYGKTLRDALTEFAGEEISQYFASLPSTRFQDNVAFNQVKSAILENFNVLLLCDQKEDYQDLLAYGFKNVDYFKSTIAADKYYQEHPEALKQFHLVIVGDRAVCSKGYLPLDGMLEGPAFESIRVNYYSTIDVQTVQRTFCIFLSDFKHALTWTIESPDINVIFEEMLKSLYVSEVMTDFQPKPFNPHQTLPDHQPLPIPTSKSDLNILCYYNYVDLPVFQETVSKLGLDITLKEENNYSLNELRHVLGDYDIIIASADRSNALVHFNNESTEQCRTTGRNLTVLTTYSDTYISSFAEEKIAPKILLRHSYGGPLATNDSVQANVVRYLNSYEPNQNLEWSYKAAHLAVLCAIEASISFYNQALLAKGFPALTDQDIKSVDDMNLEYMEAKAQNEEREKAAYEAKRAKEKPYLDAIREFDDMTVTITNYLHGKKGYRRLENVAITEYEGGYKIENYFYGQVGCVLTILKEHRADDLRIFGIQILSSKGKLLPEETVGLYTTDYEGQEGIPKRPSEKHLKALAAIYKKVKYAVAHQEEKNGPKLSYTNPKSGKSS